MPTDFGGKIQLTDEIKQLHNLIDINRRRFHYLLDLDLFIDEGKGRPLIIPLILLTLTENIFKHGDFRGKKAWIRLKVDNTGTLAFSTCNGKRVPGYAQSNTGIGMQNTRLCLDYAYGDDYALEINDDRDDFRLDLTIKL